MPEAKIAEEKKETETQDAENIDVVEEVACDHGCEYRGAPKYAPCILRKLHSIRIMTLGMDWFPDKAMKVGTGGYPYLSIDKMKANLNPAFARVGLEVIPSYEDIVFRPAIGNMSQHVTLTLVMDVVDVETGQSITYRQFGEAGDSGDKALSKACTYALKTWLSGVFLLSDGFDPNMLDGLGVEPVKQFTKPTPIEAVEMKSRVLDAGIKPAAPAKPAPAVKKAEAPKAPAKPSTDGKKPTPIQENAMKKIVDNWTEAAKDGKVGADRFNDMSCARATVETQADAIDFIAKFEEVN